MTAELQNLELSDFECGICSSLLFKPVTTPCGHTFCQPCLARSLDHSSSCPVCRATTYVMPSQPVNVLLLQLIKKTFPNEYKQRCSEEGDSLLDQSHMPLFILDAVLFPNQNFSLHIFEPRYRLMLRRCLESSRCFGIVFYGNELATVGCVAEIQRHVALPDGRSLIETVGRKRFDILSSKFVDGYAVGRVQFFDDDDLPSATPTTATATTTNATTTSNTNTNTANTVIVSASASSSESSISTTTTTAPSSPTTMSMAQDDNQNSNTTTTSSDVSAITSSAASSVAQISNAVLSQQVMQELESKAGLMWNQLKASITAKFGSVPNNPYELSMYLPSVLPIDNETKQMLLECRTTRARLTELRRLVVELGCLDGRGGRCSIQ